MRMIIDRFEEDCAVLELDGGTISAPRELFAGAREGDTVEITILPRPEPDDDDSPHSVFERLRKKKKRGRR